MSRLTTLATLVLVAACLVVSAGCSRSPEAQKARHLERGEKFLARRPHKVAFKEAVARDPKSVQAHTALAQFYALTGDLGRTEEELKTAADLSPNGSLPRMQLADFYIRTGKRDPAKAVLTDITAKDPEYLPAW